MINLDAVSNAIAIDVENGIVMHASVKLVTFVHDIILNSMRAIAHAHMRDLMNKTESSIKNFVQESLMAEAKNPEQSKQITSFEAQSGKVWRFSERFAMAVFNEEELVVSVPKIVTSINATTYFYSVLAAKGCMFTVS